MGAKMFPLQTSRHAPSGPLQIPWSVAEIAYGAYAKECGRGQSLERLAERGGFGWCEMDRFYPGWREAVSELVQVRADNERLRAACQRVLDYYDHGQLSDHRAVLAQVHAALQKGAT